MYKVGITGGIGSGKSTVCAMLEEYGIAVYNSDHRAKELMASDERLRSRLIERFGEAVYGPEGINREYLARRVFASAEELQAAETAQILTIVYETTGILPENVSIIKKA